MNPILLERNHLTRRLAKSGTDLPTTTLCWNSGAAGSIFIDGPAEDEAVIRPPVDFRPRIRLKPRRKKPVVTGCRPRAVFRLL